MLYSSYIVRDRATKGGSPLVIDTHVHVYSPELISDWEKIAERESYFATLVRGAVHKWATAEDLLLAMDEDGVDESWICGFGFQDLALCRIANDYVLDAAAASGGKLRALCVVPPLAPGAEAEVARCAERGAIGVGELFPDGQCFDIADVRETWRLAASCHEHNLFVLLHVAEPVGREYPGKGKTGPREAAQFARNHPELRVVMAHFGGGLFLYEQMRDVRENLKNVWYDTAAAPFLYAPSIFRTCTEADVADKMLYGSDYPLLRYPRYQSMIQSASLEVGALCQSLANNARGLLGV